MCSIASRWTGLRGRTRGWTTGVAGDGNWLALGFVDGQGTAVTNNNRFISGSSIGKAWLFHRGDPNLETDQSWLGNAASGTGDSVQFPAGFPGGGGIDLRVVLDTTGGAGNWTATWFAKLQASGTYIEVRPEATLLDETINAVGLAKSNDGIQGTVISFSLTSVPEPGSLALLGLSAVFMLHRRLQ